MTDRDDRYFPLSLDSLRAIGGWSADCAERALTVYESQAGSDARPREAIEGIREFAAGGRRTARLRTLALAAHAAAREIGDPAASAAARAAGTAAASAYTHPLADVQQTKHIVGSAAYAALALELAGSGDPRAAEKEIRWAVEHAPSEAREVLLQMPARQPGKSRLETVLYELDAGVRAARPSAAGPLFDTTIRPESAADVAAIRDINITAFRDHPFSDQTEHLIVDALRDAAALSISLVSVREGRVVGHVAFSEVEVGEMPGWFLLGPVAVLPDFQRQGIGSALVEAGLERLRERGASGCVLVGDAAFYGRFGFSPFPDLEYEGVPHEHVLGLPMAGEVPGGRIRAHIAFEIEPV